MDQRVVYGRTAVFSVVAVSGTTLSYQWYEDGLLFLDRKLTGETSSILNIPNAGTADEGQYFVDVKNADGTVRSSKASLSVVPNSPPVANNDSYTTLEDVPLTVPAAGFLSNDTDGDGDALAGVLVSDVSNGVLSFNPNGSFTYIPNANFNGSDSFTYRAMDFANPPTILERSVVSRNKIEIEEGQKGAQSFRHGPLGGPAYTISKIILRLSRESTAPNSSLSFNIGTGINSGAIAGSSVAIDPSSITNTSQGDSFQAYEIAFGTPVGPLTAGTIYYLNLECEASNGKRIWSDYDDQNNYSSGTYYKGGSDDMKDILFQIYGTPNSGSTSGVATVTINVVPANDPPTAVNDSTNTLENTSVTINVLANDYDPEGMPLILTGTAAANGTAVISGTNIVFTPSANFNGTAVFDYIVSDGALSAIGRVTVAVMAASDVPVANNDSYPTPEDAPLVIPAPGVLTNDANVDGKALSAVLASDVTHGKLSLKPDGSFAYTPDAGYNGPDSFTYHASDGSATGNLATVTINVMPVNDPLRFTSQRMTGNGFELHVSGPDSSTYVILASSNLADWTPIYTNFMALGNLTFTDTDATNNPNRFYRAETR